MSNVNIQGELEFFVKGRKVKVNGEAFTPFSEPNAFMAEIQSKDEEEEYSIVLTKVEGQGSVLYVNGGEVEEISSNTLQMVESVSFA